MDVDSLLYLNICVRLNLYSFIALSKLIELCLCGFYYPFYAIE